VREAAQLGFRRAGVPEVQKAEAEVAGVEVVPLATLREGVERLLGEKAAPARREEPVAERSPR